MKKQTDKWRFAIGTTSRVPNSGGLHYLIADFDNSFPLTEPFNYGVILNCRTAILQKTNHGWHLYTDIAYRFEKLIQTLKIMGADPTWIKIGKERGYFFLADKSEIDFPYPVEHMVIHYAKKKR